MKEPAGDAPYYGQSAGLTSLSSAVRSGSLRDQLVALRGYLAARLDDFPHPRDAAPLAKQLAEVLVKLDELPVDDGEVSPVVDLTARINEKLRGPSAAAA